MDRDLFQRAFLKSVRTAIIVDDQFPTYGWLASNHQINDGNAVASEGVVPKAGAAPARNAVGVTGDASSLDPRRAAALWETFRARGWSCDVDNGKGLKADDRRLGEADLAVLDYELTRGDPEQAIALLRSLAVSDHASLAVVYTKRHDLREIRLLVAAQLRGHLPRNRLGAVENVRESLADAGLQADAELVLAYLRNKGMETPFGKKAAELCEGREGVQPLDVLRDAAEHYLGETLKATTVRDDLPQPFEIDQSDGNDAPLWIWCNNLFVTFLEKKDVENEGGRLIDELVRAIVAWDPGGLMTTLAYARGLIAQRGFRSVANALVNRELNAGLLYFANYHCAADERQERIKQFYVRLLSAFVEQIVENVAEFGSKALDRLPLGEDPVSWACKQVRLPYEKADDVGKSVIFELNRFMATEDPGQYVRLGTIFETVQKGGEAPVIWMIATPACDLVPRAPHEKSHLWEAGLHPLRAVTCIRAQEKGLNKLHRYLKEAEYSRHVFARRGPGGEKLVLEFLPDPESPQLEHIYLKDMGKITDGNFEGWRLSNKDGCLQLNNATFRVVTQVRNLHANRFLRAAGEHLSRIGVDFVKYSEVDKGGKKKEPAESISDKASRPDTP
jgi:hypothetical protein